MPHSALSVKETNRLLETAAREVRAALQQLDFAGAKRLIHEKVLSLAPQQPTAWADLASIEQKQKNHETAYRYALQSLSYYGSRPDAHIYDILTAICHELNRLEEMRFYGRAAIRERKRDSAANGRPAHPLPDTAPPGLSDNPSANIISYSLFGNRERYCETAVINARLAKVVYPEWTCRFYVDDTVPQHVIRRLRAHGAQVVEVDERQRRISGLYWRFFVADDPDVQCFIVRDADSLLSNKERAAVDAWLASGKWFHVMRDADIHVELILAGMWGGYRGTLGNLQQAAADYFHQLPFTTRIIDQEFLRYAVWPTVVQSVLVHDNRGLEDGSLPFPDYTLTDIEKTPYFHVGMIDAGALETNVTVEDPAAETVRWHLVDEQQQIICSYEAAVQNGKLVLALPYTYSLHIREGKWQIYTETLTRKNQTAREPSAPSKGNGKRRTATTPTRRRKLEQA